MGQNHSMPTSLAGLAALDAPVSSESSMRWARELPTRLVVFIHGYGGRAVTTWGDFADLAMEHPAYARTDLAFLGYESRSRRAAYNKAVIFQAVQRLAEQNTTVAAAVGGPSRSSDFTYDRIVLVGHSLGGALARAVAHDAKLSNAPWADKLRLGLFAPAHMGADVIRLVQLSTGFFKFSGLVEVAAVLASPALTDLKRDSDFMQGLLQDARRIGPHCTTQASFVVHAAEDRVVSPDRFFEDPPLLPYADHDHVSCCKPRWAGFDRPVSDVARALA